MIAPFRLFRRVLLMLTLSIPVMSGMGQSGMQFPIGASRQFEIRSAQGTTFCWRVLDQLNSFNGKESDQVTFLTDKCSHAVILKWEKAGIFFLQVTAVNQYGCTNSKIIKISVLENHLPVANNDYGFTTWIKSLTINVLNNDHDDEDDLKASTLKILTKPEYGHVEPGLNGKITYTPLQSQAGSVFFKYMICDACNQCDTAKVVIEVREPPLFLPQGLSPNGDGINDMFVIKGLEAYPNSSLTIFSRNGLVLYSSDNYQNDWAGTMLKKNKDISQLQSGTYYYLLLPGGSKHFIKGFIYLSY